MDPATRKVPLAFFAYNRPAHTAAALEALAACPGRDHFEFHFYSDGPRNAAAEPGVAEVRRVLRDQAGRFSARLIEQSANLGLAKSIVSGVSALCERYGRVVVLEDDLVVAPDFLRFMAAALDRYADAPEVMQVAGYTIAPPKDLPADAFLLPVTTTWGWGTWARAWHAFSWTPEGWPATRSDMDWLDRFEIGGVGNYVSMLEDRLAGRNDSWGILWWYAVSRRMGEVVYPRESLVWNSGFDGTGVHCGAGGALGQGSRPDGQGRLLGDAIRFPDATRHRPEHYALLRDYLREQSALPVRARSRLRGLIDRARRGLRHALGG